MQSSIIETITSRVRFKYGTAVGARDRAAWVELAASAAVFTVPLFVYTLTLAPTVYNLDSAELAIAAATGGVMRATGYPLYLLVGRIWSLIPVGDVGYRMNLLSAVCGAFGVWLAYRIMRRLGVGRTGAAGAAGLLAAAPAYWRLSLIAEVYTLHVVMMGILILLLLRWADDPTPLNISLAAGWTGLSLTHHLAALLLVPGIAVFVISRKRGEPLLPKEVFGALAAFLLGLSIYLYLPFLYAGEPVFNYAGLYDEKLVFQPVDLSSAAGLWWLVTGRSFASRMFAYEGAALWRETLHYFGHLSRSFLVAGIPLGLFGFAALLRRDRRLAGMLALMFGLSAFFFIDYAVVDKDTMFLPTYLVWALFAGLGYRALEDRFGDRAAGRVRRALQVAVVCLALAAAVLTGPEVDLSGDRSTRQAASGILAAAEQDAVIFGWWETVPPLQYLQIIEGRRPDVRIVNRFLISREAMYRFIQREIDRRPIYIDVVPDEWVYVFEPVPVGDLYRLERIVYPERIGVRIGGR